MEYKIHQWYRGGYDNRFYYYFWAIVNGHLVGGEYDVDGNYAAVDAWDDEAFTRWSDATFQEVDKDWDPMDHEQQEIVEHIIMVLWEYCQ